jgi:teichuronic acid biosynthesis glycosyltransferase TuaH
MEHDLVFVSLEDWDEIWRRNQFLCSELARRFPERRILFVGRARNVAHCLRDRQLSALTGSRTAAVQGFPNIWFTQALKVAPERHTWGRRINEVATELHIRAAMRLVGISQPLLWLNPHSAGHLAGQLGERHVVYDITDDWTLAILSDRDRRLVQEQDASVCRAADLVIVCSDALQESRQDRCRRLLLLPNGVDVEHYASVRESKGERIWPGPVLGYAGTLHPDRIDVNLVLSLAGSFPDGSVVLLGPDHLDPESRKRLSKVPNVYVPGPVPYSRIPAMLAAFDVCIVPHVETPFTESLNPLKLWEYLACGKPIVSTDVAGFRDYPHWCRIASGGQAFATACRLALAEGDLHSAARIAEAGRHTWKARVDVLLDNLAALEACSPREPAEARRVIGLR